MSGGVKSTSGRRGPALLALAVAAVALCFGALAGSAGASKVTAVRSVIKIYSGNSERFSGRVITGKKAKACMKARKVTLYVNSASAGQRTLGRLAGYESVGTATTHQNGTWLVRSRAEPFLAGVYRAYVAPKRVTSGGEAFLCLPMYSRATNA